MAEAFDGPRYGRPEHCEHIEQAPDIDPLIAHMDGLRDYDRSRDLTYRATHLNKLQAAAEEYRDSQLGLTESSLIETNFSPEMIRIIHQSVDWHQQHKQGEQHGIQEEK